ncbi:hypothetical protein CSUI_010222 [Cystoisospora suis]|uniref:Uncharacterized protein n=1 Tax=Cystoisospora suis TaxID=483139 RepID=A0A2C6KHU2_9APIC|nr:hypothetical protein CSUI_010222 [Cystoisospora suis]
MVTQSGSYEVHRSSSRSSDDAGAMNRFKRSSLFVGEGAWWPLYFISKARIGSVHGRHGLPTSAARVPEEPGRIQGSEVVRSISLESLGAASGRPAADTITSPWHAALQRAFQRETREWFLQKKQGTLWHLWDPPGVVFSRTKISKRGAKAPPFRSWYFPASETNSVSSLQGSSSPKNKQNRGFSSDFSADLGESLNASKKPSMTPDVRAAEIRTHPPAEFKPCSLYFLSSSKSSVAFLVQQILLHPKSLYVAVAPDYDILFTLLRLTGKTFIRDPLAPERFPNLRVLCTHPMHVPAFFPEKLVREVYVFLSDSQRSMGTSFTSKCPLLSPRFLHQLHPRLQTGAEFIVALESACPSSRGGVNCAYGPHGCRCQLRPCRAPSRLENPAIAHRERVRQAWDGLPYSVDLPRVHGCADIRRQCVSLSRLLPLLENTVLIEQRSGTEHQFNAPSVPFRPVPGGGEPATYPVLPRSRKASPQRRQRTGEFLFALARPGEDAATHETKQLSDACLSVIVKDRSRDPNGLGGRFMNKRGASHLDRELAGVVCEGPGSHLSKSVGKPCSVTRATTMSPVSDMGCLEHSVIPDPPKHAPRMRPAPAEMHAEHAESFDSPALKYDGRPKTAAFVPAIVSQGIDGYCPYAVAGDKGNSAGEYDGNARLPPENSNRVRHRAQAAATPMPVLDATCFGSACEEFSSRGAAAGTWTEDGEAAARGECTLNLASGGHVAIQGSRGPAGGCLALNREKPAAAPSRSLPKAALEPSSAPTADPSGSRALPRTLTCLKLVKLSSQLPNSRFVNCRSRHQSLCFSVP